MFAVFAIVANVVNIFFLIISQLLLVKPGFTLCRCSCMFSLLSCVDMHFYHTSSLHSLPCDLNFNIIWQLQLLLSFGNGYDVAFLLSCL